MILDYVEATRNYVLRVPRGEADPRSLMAEHGLDWSRRISTAQEAVLYTSEPYAACAFAQYATPAAQEKLLHLTTEIDASWANDSQSHIRVPADQELWPFQKASIAYAMRRQNTLIADQPGLGKTPIAIAFANEIAAKRVLVICPASIRLQWWKRIEEWSTMDRLIVHTIMHGKSGVHPNAQWTVCSYELARSPPIWKVLAEGTYDLLILDEAHYLKNVDTRRTRAVFGGGDLPIAGPLAEQCGAILALTGTPLPNRPREAYVLARGMCFDSIDWLSEDKFKARFNPSMKMETTDKLTGKTKIWIDERSGRHSELQARLRANFMVRHLKRDVMPQLHMPIYDIIQLEETHAVKLALAAERLLDIDPENLEGADATVLGHIAVVRRQMGVALAPQVADYVSMLLDGGETKLVLFAWHIEVLDILEKRLNKHGVLRVDGRTSGTAKQRKIEQFQTDPAYQIIMGNVLSLGTGTDGLQTVSIHALLAEPDWVHGNNEQCFDRLDRGGQRGQVQGDILVAPGSFAEKVLASALRKAKTTHAALDRRMEL